MPAVQVLIRRLHKWAYANDNSPARRWRRRRMIAFLKCVTPPPRARILDLGGTRRLWDDFDHGFHVILVDLSSPRNCKQDTGRYQFIVGDACDLQDIFANVLFDVVFSNSVIEHVGSWERRQAFAGEVRRLGRDYWIQTPSHRFVSAPASTYFRA